MFIVKEHVVVFFVVVVRLLCGVCVVVSGPLLGVCVVVSGPL